MSKVRLCEVQLVHLFILSLTQTVLTERARVPGPVLNAGDTVEGDRKQTKIPAFLAGGNNQQNK